MTTSVRRKKVGYVAIGLGECGLAAASGPGEEDEGTEAGVLVDVGDALEHIDHVGGEVQKDLVAGGHGGAGVVFAGEPELLG